MDNLYATKVIHEVLCEIVGIAVDFMCKVGHGSVGGDVRVVEGVFELHWGVAAVFDDVFLGGLLVDGVDRVDQDIWGWRRGRMEWLGWRGCGWRG